MTDTTAITWTDGMAFDADVEGFDLSLDAATEFGGQGKGPKPKTLMLTALAGCTGMDVVSILRKMRVPMRRLRISVDGELGKDHPKVYERIHVTYRLEGDGLDPEKVGKAAALSQERYCGVSAMLGKTATVTYHIEINGQKLG